MTIFCGICKLTQQKAKKKTFEFIFSDEMNEKNEKLLDFGPSQLDELQTTYAASLECTSDNRRCISILSHKQSLIRSRKIWIKSPQQCTKPT